MVRGTPIFNHDFRDHVWVPLLKHLDVPSINIHGLRHTFGTILGTSGVDPAKNRGLLGHHSSAISVDEYVTQNRNGLRKAVSVFSRKVNRTPRLWATQSGRNRGFIPMVDRRQSSGRGRLAPVPSHHLACGSALGGSPIPGT